MSTTKFSDAVSFLGRALPSTGPEVLDADLLARYATSRDELAFENLVRRYGPMVFGVCRRVTGDHHLAEDVFQAVFVVLAAKAGSIRPQSALSGWLYGVAYRTALRARTKSDRRGRRETLVETLPEHASQSDEPVETPATAIAALEQEIVRLPDHYRTVVVLCELQGQSRKDAASQLGVAEGTISSRLAAARHALAVRLRQRGVALSAIGLSGALVQSSTASVPTNLIANTVAVAIYRDGISAAVARLSKSVLLNMLVQKFKSLIPALVLTIAGVFSWVLLAPAIPTAPDRLSHLPTGDGQQLPKLISQPNPKAADSQPLPKSLNKLLFYRAGQLNLIDPDGKNEQKVTEDRDKFYHGPARLSPDGKRIAYLIHVEKLLVPEKGNRLPPRHLYVKELDEKGSGTDLGGFRCKGYDFAWSPDGSQVVVSEETDHHYIIDIKTKVKTTLNLPKDHSITDWSRDGKYFLTTTINGEFTPDSIPDARLHLMNRDGTEHKTLTDPMQFNAFGRLSPDGKRVLYYGCTLPSANDPGGWHLHLLDISTGKSSKVEDTPVKWQPMGICWSPDGKRIAYSWQEVNEDKKKKTQSHLVVCDADGKNAKTIASEKDENFFSPAIGQVDWR